MNHRQSSNELSGAASKTEVMKLVSQQDAEELDNTCKKQIGFRSQNIGSFTVRNTQGIFQRVNRALYTGAVVIDLSKSGIVSRDSGIQAQVSMERDINTAAIF